MAQEKPSSKAAMARSLRKSLDFAGDEFNPRRALKAVGLEPPYPDMRPLNNLAEYESVMQRRAKPQPATTGGSQEKAKERSASTARSLIRPATEPTARGKTVEKFIRRRLTIKSFQDTVAGPLSLLHRAVTDKLLVRVWIRRFRGVRGVCLGYVVAFDYQWNLAMMDVDEEYCLLPWQCPIEAQSADKGQARMKRGVSGKAKEKKKRVRSKHFWRRDHAEATAKLCEKESTAGCDELLKHEKEEQCFSSTVECVGTGATVYDKECVEGEMCKERGGVAMSVRSQSQEGEAVKGELLHEGNASCLAVFGTDSIGNATPVTLRPRRLSSLQYERLLSDDLAVSSGSDSSSSVVDSDGEESGNDSDKDVSMNERTPPKADDELEEGEVVDSSDAEDDSENEQETIDLPDKKPSHGKDSVVDHNISSEEADQDKPKTTFASSTCVNRFGSFWWGLRGSNVVVRKRHANQLFIRGDNVVMVTVVDGRT